MADRLASVRLLYVADDLDDLPSALRAERGRRGLTQSEVAASFKVRTQTVSMWESGSKPQVRFHERLAEFLRLSGTEELQALIAKGSVDDETDPDVKAGPSAGHDSGQTRPGNAPPGESDPVPVVLDYLRRAGNRLTPDEVKLLQTLLDRR